VQQNQMIRQFTNVNVANVTNNLTVVNNNLTVNNRDVSPHVMVAPLRVAPKLQPQLQIQQITDQVRQQEAKVARQTRQIAVSRRNAETAMLKDRPPMKFDPKGGPKGGAKIDP